MMLINEVATDLENPPKFVKASIGEMPKHAIDGCRAKYPDLKSKVFDNSDVAATFAAAEKAAKQMPRWTLTVTDAEKGVLEGFATSFLLRFKDDFVIRIAGNGANGAVVDMRSKSRVGRSDLGANHHRVTEFFDHLVKQLAPAATPGEKAAATETAAAGETAVVTETVKETVTTSVTEPVATETTAATAETVDATAEKLKGMHVSGGTVPETAVATEPATEKTI